MPDGFDDDWSATVCAALDSLFLGASAGFSRSSPGQPRDGVVSDMLWEADPLRFAERYPDSGVVESYGAGWPPPCIDYWVYVDVPTRLAMLSTEGWTGDHRPVELSGRGAVDARRLAAALGEILSVPAED
ncbi:hypothetical protein [Intrasporangium sp. YIM S08009]|uniref:hypothetical protein n=1 Tax=Intrasporangium zincisolvens TaxID=3080018 RepID=UPI002B05AB2B|nr:hypothetical protein [Intrasporangium sp. YIM S08009]